MTIRLWWLFLSTGFILALHYAALRFDLYHQGIALDLTQHFVGGILAGSFTLYAVQRDSFRAFVGSMANARLEALLLVGGAAVLGYLWEVYEYVRWQWDPATYLYYNNNFDSLSDQGVALAGACVMGLAHLAVAWWRGSQPPSP